MIQLRIYPYNLSGQGSEYTCQKLYFQSFYIGMKRDEIDQRVIRKITTGSILLKHPIDFDTLQPFFSQPQDAQIYYDAVWYWCRITFFNINYTTKKVSLTLKFLDQYSELLDGIRSLSWLSNQIPYISRKKTPFEANELNNGFVDGSSYQYGSLWGIEAQDVTADLKVYVKDVYKFNTGGDNVKGDSLDISQLCVGTQYLDEYYHPDWIKYTDRGWGVTNKYFFRVCRTIWRREYRYFATTEEVTGGWDIGSGTQTINGVDYQKYIRPYHGTDEKYFTGKQNYFIRDEVEYSGQYMTAEYEGYSTDLQKSNYYYEVKSLFKKLFDSFIGTGTLSFGYGSDLWITSLMNHNFEGFYQDKFSLDIFINFFRDKFGLYFWYDGTDIGLNIHVWRNRLLFDLENYKDKNWVPSYQPEILPVDNIYRFSSASKRLDFNDQIVSFYGYNESEKQISEGIVTDIEITDESETEYMLINTMTTLSDQIYERFHVGTELVGSEAVLRSMNGKFISWDYELLDNSSYIRFDLFSNTVYNQVNTQMRLSFGYVVKDGTVRVTIDGHVYPFTETYGTFSNYFNVSDTSVSVKVTVDGISEDVKGFLYGIKLEAHTRLPKAVTGIISGRGKKNGDLCLANTVKNWNVPMAWEKGFLEDYGTIYPDTVFNRELSLKLPIEEDIFEEDQVFNSYLKLGTDKYCIFERKREILAEDKISILDEIIAKTNDVY